MLSLAKTKGWGITRRTRGGERGPRKVEKGDEERGGLVLPLLLVVVVVVVEAAAAAAAAAAVAPACGEGRRACAAKAVSAGEEGEGGGGGGREGRRGRAREGVLCVAATGELEGDEGRGTAVAEEEEGEETEAEERREDEDEEGERRGCQGLRILSFCAHEVMRVGAAAAGVVILPSSLPPSPSPSLLTPLS